MSDATSSSRCEFPFDAFLVLAGKLQETAQAMLAFCRSASAEKDSSKTEDDAELAEHGCKPGEYCQYHLPPLPSRKKASFLTDIRPRISPPPWTPFTTTFSPRSFL